MQSVGLDSSDTENSEFLRQVFFKAVIDFRLSWDQGIV
jgi:hypothetical protein